jgi:hypothetical protein
MTKDDLLGVYRTALNQIKFAYTSMILWAYPDTPQFFEALYAELGSIPKPFANITRFVHDDTAMRIACEQAYDSAHMSALKDLLGITRSYCHETGQLDLLKRQPWFQFWKILRNCFAHDTKFNFNEAERALLPISWSGVTIDTSMDGQHLTHGRMSREKMRELVETAYEFIEKELV